MYRVGLIGLGNIASRYSTPADPFPYCHAGGIWQCKSTDLVAVADMDKNRLSMSANLGDSFSRQKCSILQ